MKNGLKFEDLRKEEDEKEGAHIRDGYGRYTPPFWHGFFYYLRENSILVSLGLDEYRSTVRTVRTVESLREATKYLAIDLIIAFDEYSNLPEYL